MSEQNISLGEAWPHEMARCKQLLNDYKALGPVGAFGHAMIEIKIRTAEEAWASGDIIAIVQAYWDMKGCE